MAAVFVPVQQSIADRALGCVALLVPFKHRVPPCPDACGPARPMSLTQNSRPPGGVSSARGRLCRLCWYPSVMRRLRQGLLCCHALAYASMIPQIKAKFNTFGRLLFLVPILCASIEIGRSASKSWHGRANERGASPMRSRAERRIQSKVSTDCFLWICILITLGSLNFLRVSQIACP